MNRGGDYSLIVSDESDSFVSGENFCIIHCCICFVLSIISRHFSAFRERAMQNTKMMCYLVIFSYHQVIVRWWSMVVLSPPEEPVCWRAKPPKDEGVIGAWRFTT